MSNVSAKRLKGSEYSIGMEAGDMRWIEYGNEIRIRRTSQVSQG